MIYKGICYTETVRKAMELSDGTITIQPFTNLADAQTQLANEDEEHQKWLSGGVATLEGVQNWIKKNQEYWENDGPVFAFGIWTKEDKLIGMVEARTSYEEIEGLQKGDANISYSLYPFARGKGYASRAVNLILQFLKNKGIQRGVIRVDPDNKSSLKVPLRCGFREAKKITTKDNKRLIIFQKQL